MQYGPPQRGARDIVEHGAALALSPLFQNEGPDGLARQIRSVRPALIPVVYHRTKCSVWQ